MSEVAQSAILWNARDTMLLILGLAIVVVTLGGCSGDFDQAAFAPNVISLQPTHAPPPAPREVEPVSAPPEPVQPQTDPGADAIVGQIAKSIRSRNGDAEPETRISLSRLYNQSHASGREFEALRNRLARVLNLSGRSHGMWFEVQPSASIDYELHGAAYLITVAGRDQWELHLSLRPAGGSWTVWRADAPLRMFRQFQGGDRQILWPDTDPQ
ncbi:MAG: hypothetical protein IIA64_11300 [Planctomycetes bacterium]|nr:hypothetical protein [Planctomycetota bacterium]